MPAVLHPKTEALLEDVPPFLAGSHDFRAAADVIVRETQRVEEAANKLRRNFTVDTADDYLGIFETMLGLTVNPPDKSLAQRRASVRAFLGNLSGSGSGLLWQASVTQLIGTGWEHREYHPDDPGGPPPNHVLVSIPFTPEIADPTAAPTLTATADAASTLPAGTYFYAYSVRNGYGETRVSPTAQITVPAGRRVTVDFAAVIGAQTYGIYRGTSATDLRRIAYPTTDIYEDRGAEATLSAPPGDNTTESYQAAEVRRLLRQATPAHIEILLTYSQGFIVGHSILGEGAL